MTFKKQEIMESERHLYQKGIDARNINSCLIRISEGLKMDLKTMKKKSKSTNATKQGHTPYILCETT